MLKRSVPWATIDLPQKNRRSQNSVFDRSIFAGKSPGKSPHSQWIVIHCLIRGAFRQRFSAAPVPAEANVSLVSCQSRTGSSRPSWIAARAPAPRSSGSRSTGTTLATPLGAKMSWLKLNGNFMGSNCWNVYLIFFLWRVSWDNANDQRNWCFFFGILFGGNKVNPMILCVVFLKWDLYEGVVR